MLGENIRILRKQKGYSQETLALQLHVVRQTVSKWEKGLSVPDAEMLQGISELFEVPVQTLLGSNIPEPEKQTDARVDEIAVQLALLNDQLAQQTVRRRKITKRILIGIPVAIVLLFVVYMVCFIAVRTHLRSNTVLSATGIECELNGETYYYEVVYDQNYQIHEAGGDAWISNHVMPEGLGDDANVLLAQIEDYFTDRGGSYKIIEKGVQTPGHE